MPGCSSLSCKLQASEEIGKPAVTANKRQHIPSELASISASTCVESAPKRCVCLGNVDPSFPVAVYSTIPGPGSTLSLHRFCGTGLGGLAGGRVGMGGGGVGFSWERTRPRALLPGCSHIPIGLSHSQCFPGSRLTAEHSHALLCCLPPLFNHIFNITDGFAPLRGGSLPRDTLFADSLCLPELWQCPALAPPCATALHPHCHPAPALLHTICGTSWTLKAPSPRFSGQSTRTLCHLPKKKKKKKKGKGTNLHSFHKGNTKYVPSLF